MNGKESEYVEESGSATIHCYFFARIECTCTLFLGTFSLET